MDRPMLRDLPTALKALLTAFLLTLGLAYLFGLAYIFLVDIEPHQQMGMGLIESTITKYYGHRGNTKLEESLRGSMAEYVSGGEKDKILGWIRDGATEEGYVEVKPILDAKCVNCHTPATGLPIVPLTDFAEVSEVTQVDLGIPIRRLVSVSHTHLFGISFIFLLSGAIFALSGINRLFKVIVVTLPFVAIWVDIGSWWFTKYEPAFAYTVIIGGLLMGLSLIVQILISIGEMWFKRRGRVDG